MRRAWRLPDPRLLRAIGTDSLRLIGFLGWALSCSWLYHEYYYDFLPSQGPSMYPTLGTSTKYLIIDKRHRLGRNLAVGDIIHAKHPLFPSDTYIGKRVLGLPGDFVVRDADRAEAVGGWSGKERERERQGGTDTDTVKEKEKEQEQEPEMIEVPAGHVWVAGDNMSWSRDSRFYGPLPMGLIMGKVVAYSNPSSDWIVDMVGSRGDQLRVGVESGTGGGDGERDGFSVQGGKTMVKTREWPG